MGLTLFPGQIEIVGAEAWAHARVDRQPWREADRFRLAGGQIEGIVGIASLDIGFDHDVQRQPGGRYGGHRRKPSGRGAVSMVRPEARDRALYRYRGYSVLRPLPRRSFERPEEQRVGWNVLRGDGNERRRAIGWARPRGGEQRLPSAVERNQERLQLDRHRLGRVVTIEKAISRPSVEGIAATATGWEEAARHVVRSPSNVRHSRGSTRTPPAKCSLSWPVEACPCNGASATANSRRPSGSPGPAGSGSDRRSSENPWGTGSSGTWCRRCVRCRRHSSDASPSPARRC